MLTTTDAPERRLSDNERREIRRTILDYATSCEKLADQYGVSEATIARILRSGRAD